MIQLTAGYSRSSMVPSQENADIFIQGRQSRGIRPAPRKSGYLRVCHEVWSTPTAGEQPARDGGLHVPFTGENNGAA